MYLSKLGYVVKKESLTEDQIIKLEQDLKVIPLSDEKYNFNKNTDSSYLLYTKTINKFYIPKMYGINTFGQPNSISKNFEGEIWKSEIPFCGTLLEHQLLPVEKLYNACVDKGGGILCLSTGLGKTVSSLQVLSRLKRKTIIIVNKIPLMKQWEQEITTFLPCARIGFLQGQKNINLQNKDIVIAMLQSLARIDYPKSLLEDFGTCIVDECHNLSSRVFSQVLTKLCCKYTIGLSATPTRSDGCEFVFKYHLGDIVYKSNSERKGLNPVLIIAKVKSKEYKQISTTNRFTGKEQIQFTSMLTELTEMNNRNNFVINSVLELLKLDDKRRILILSDRREHLKSLKSILDEKNSEYTNGLFVGQMKAKDLQTSMKSQIILATFQAFGEGVNVKELDTLFLVTPKKFIGHLSNSTRNESGKLEQIVGRIFRKEHLTKHPLIIDIYDTFSVYKNQFSQRKVFYKQHFKQLLIDEQNIDLDNLENLYLNFKKGYTSDLDNLDLDNLDSCVIE